jgi:hypothetical protein
LLLVGIILMTANSVKAKKTTTEKIVYKDRPIDIDEFYRQESMRKPSTLYYSIFTNEDLKR